MALPLMFWVGITLAILVAGRPLLPSRQGHLLRHLRPPVLRWQFQPRLNPIRAPGCQRLLRPRLGRIWVTWFQPRHSFWDVLVHLVWEFISPDVYSRSLNLVAWFFCNILGLCRCIKTKKSPSVWTVFISWHPGGATSVGCQTADQKALHFEKEEKGP